MSAHVLLNFLNKCGALLCIFSLFANKFNKFNNTQGSHRLEQYLN